MEFMLQVLLSLCLITFTVESELFGSQRPIIAPAGDDEASIQLVVNPQIICPSEPVEAAVSQDVTLHCHLVPPLDATNMTVEWRNESQNRTVHLYQDGRTSLFPEGLTEGNLSLKISLVQLSDSGRYRCSLTSENLQHSCSVNLTVVPAGNVNRTELIYNYNNTTDTIIIVAIVVPFAVVALFVNIFVIYKVRRRRLDAMGDVAQTLDYWSSFMDFANTLGQAVEQS